MIFKSSHPDIHPPTHPPLYTFLFSPTSPSSPFHPSRSSDSQSLGRYTNPLTNETLDFAAVKRHATHISTALVRGYGLVADDTIAVVGGGSVWYPVGCWAGIRVGAKIAGASPAYNVSELTYALRTAGARFVFASTACLEVALAAAENAGVGRGNVFLIEGEGPEGPSKSAKGTGFMNLRELSELGEAYGEHGQVDEFEIPRGRTNRDVCGFLCFSSGTTGLPKAVMISHHNIIAQMMQLRAINPRDPSTILAVLPLFHVTGLVRFINLPIYLNDTLLLLPHFNLRDMLHTISRFSVRELNLVPPLIIRLLNDPLVAQYDLSSLASLSCGAAPLSRELVSRLAERFPDVKFRQGYGMTESTACITSHSEKFQGFEFADTVGDLVPGTEVRIVGVADGVDVGVGEEGEILARGPQIAMGYLGDEEASKVAFGEDGWLRTGDVGCMGGNGLLRITDRIKELIKVKGIGVAPAEIEDALLGHGDVADCAVVGVRDGYAGERVKAFVVLREGVGAGEGVGRELMAFVRERKVRFKWVREIEFVDEVPKSPSGKILRRVLREWEGKEEGRGVVVRDEERAKL